MSKAIRLKKLHNLWYENVQCTAGWAAICLKSYEKAVHQNNHETGNLLNCEIFYLSR